MVFMKPLKKVFWVVVMLALIGSLADMRSTHPVLFYGMVLTCIVVLIDRSTVRTGDKE